MIDDSFVRNADIDKLNEIILKVCSEGDDLAKDIDYYQRRYKPEASKEIIKELSQKLYSNTSLLVLLSNLKDEIEKAQLKWQAMNLADANSNMGKSSPIPLKEFERSC